jgi:hypothetical protein
LPPCVPPVARSSDPVYHSLWTTERCLGNPGGALQKIVHSSVRLQLIPQEQHPFIHLLHHSMAMDQPGSNQDGVVNMTRAMQALSPWLNHPRATITTVEVLVLAAAALLLLQLLFGFYRRRWRSSFLGTALRASSKLMDALVFYTLGTMQSSPIKNSLYPVWAAFLVMASTGTTVVQHYDFYDSFRNKYTEVVVDVFRYGFYGHTG